MKVYLEVGNNSRGLMRVRNALVKYSPQSVRIVATPQEADLVILHVYGRQEAIGRKIDQIIDAGKEYAMIQYCVRSTLEPNTLSWSPLWAGAKAVWSYYNLLTLMKEDGYDADTTDFPFYYAPLGVDSEVFRDTNIERGARFLIDGRPQYVIAASAQHALSESVRECAFAAKRVRRQMLHIGHELRRGDDIVCKSNLTDEELATEYSNSEFVSGLRRIEGFELPVIEGLLCGARPIVFDKSHYRYWFNNIAEFIPETDRGKVISNLAKLFRNGSRPVTEYEKALVRQNFNWETIISRFWKMIV